MSACPPLDREIVSFRSCVRAGEAKLCERVSEKAPSLPRANALENSSGFFSSSCPYGMLCFTWVLRICVHFC